MFVDGARRGIQWRHTAAFPLILLFQQAANLNKILAIGGAPRSDVAHLFQIELGLYQLLESLGGPFEFLCGGKKLPRPKDKKGVR